MKKERIFVPPGLRLRIDKLVAHHAKALKTSEADARRTVEIAVFTAGIQELERRAREETEG